MELAPAVDSRPRRGDQEPGSIVVGGGVRSSGDAIKAIALGADAINLGTSTLLALGCTLCQRCYTGKCPWGITTNNPYLAKRLNPEIGAEQLVNLIHAWGHEMKEILGGMGLNAPTAPWQPLRSGRYSGKDMYLLGSCRQASNGVAFGNICVFDACDVALLRLAQSSTALILRKSTPGLISENQEG
jgi:hypothetical protein